MIQIESDGEQQHHTQKDEVEFIGESGVFGKEFSSQ